ncbi:hypothetical protein [Exiguobacterium flavidum]|uniref:hypothetical protein n=1 Tax=Exiguobacterium flavidum TaxID=2184695 RepID=UPI000DF7B3FB|nr:hypothetical protein [Exiguobacterium flavidum]
MFELIRRFITLSAFPNRNFLKARLAPLSAYMGTTVFLAILASAIDSFFVVRQIAYVPWLILHFIGLMITLLLWFALFALIVQVLVRMILPKPWTYRHAFPYAVAASVVAIPVTILSFQLYGTETAALTLFLLNGLYAVVPLVLARRKKRT